MRHHLTVTRTRGARVEGIPTSEIALRLAPVTWLRRGAIRSALILLPTVSVLLFDVFREVVFPGALHAWPGSLSLTALVCIGAIVSTHFIFVLLDGQKRNLLWLGQELAELAAVPTRNALRTDEVLAAYLDRLLRALPAEAAAIYLADPDGRFRRASALGGISATLAAELDLSSPAIAEAPQTGEVRWVGDYHPVGAEGPTLPAALVPLRSRDVDLGVLVLVGDSLRHYLDVLAVVGSQIAVALDNHSLFQESRDLAEQREHLAVLQERDRLAREMHDSLAQVLGLIALKARIAQDLLDGGDLSRARAEVKDVESTADVAYADVREAILGLRGALSSARQLIPALEEYVRQFSRQNHLLASLVVEGDAPTAFTPQAESQLIRVIQEALTNVRKHARASKVVVRFGAEPGYARIVVEDDGRGFVPSGREVPGRGYGLQTMAERVESLGGALSIDSKPGSGTRIVIHLPVELVATDDSSDSGRFPTGVDQA